MSGSASAGPLVVMVSGPGAISRACRKPRPTICWVVRISTHTAPARSTGAIVTVPGATPLHPYGGTSPRPVGPFLFHGAVGAREQRFGMAPLPDGTRVAYASTGTGPLLLVAPGWLSH